AALGEAMIVFEHAVERVADVLRGERNDRRGAAERGRDGRALEAVRVEQAAARHLLDVRVRIDPAGRHHPSGRIYLALAGPELLADRRNGLAADADVDPRDAGREHRGPAADDGRKRWLCHRGVLRSGRRTPADAAAAAGSGPKTQCRPT